MLTDSTDSNKSASSNLSSADSSAKRVLDYGARSSDHRAERNRRLKLTLIVGVFTKPLSLAFRLVVPPLLLGYLGGEGYGLYGAVISMAGLLGFTNLGIYFGLINRLLDCNVADDKLLARRYVSSLAIAAFALTSLFLIVWTCASVFAPWAKWLHVSDPRWIHQTPWIVWIAGSTVLLNLVLSFPTAIYAGYQDNARSYGWDAAVKLGTFIASIAVVYTRWGLIGVTYATCGTQLAFMIANSISVFHQRPWLFPQWRLFQWDLVSSTLREGIYLFALQGAVSLIFQCDKLIIGAALTAADVTLYQLVGELFLVAYGLYYMVLGPLWSFHGDAIRRGDWAWARKGLYLSMGIGIVSLGACLALLLWQDDWIFSHWTHHRVMHVPRGLILAIGMTFLMRIWVDSRSVLLNSAGVLLPQVGFFAAHAILNLIVALLAAKRFGVEGIAWATPLTALITSAWGYPLLVHRLGKRMTQHKPISSGGVPLDVAFNAEAQG